MGPKLNAFFLILNALLFGLFLWLFSVYGATGLVPGSWEYSDLVSILLTAIGLIVTFIGLIVAVAALWGYQSLRAVAAQKAEETSKQGCSEYLASDEFRAQVDFAIRERIENEAKAAVQDALGYAILRADDAPEHQEPKPNAAEEVPKGDVEEEEWRD